MSVSAANLEQFSKSNGTIDKTIGIDNSTQCLILKADFFFY